MRKLFAIMLGIVLALQFVLGTSFLAFSPFGGPQPVLAGDDIPTIGPGPRP